MPKAPTRPAPRTPLPPPTIWLRETRDSRPSADEPWPCRSWIFDRIAGEFQRGPKGSLLRGTAPCTGVHPTPPRGRHRRSHLTVLCDWHAPRAEDLIHGAADDLMPGGILAVLTSNRTHDGHFRARCGDLVAHARTTGLLYLQHIVTIHADVISDRLVPHPLPPALPRPAAGHLPIHSDVLVFAAPRPGDGVVHA